MEKEALVKMYEMERAKVLILRETRGAFSDENLEAFCNFLIVNGIKEDYAGCADFVKNTFRAYLTKNKIKETRKLGLFHFIANLLGEIKGIERIYYFFSSSSIGIINKDEIKGDLQELGVDIEDLKLRGDIDKILYVLLQGKE